MLQAKLRGLSKNEGNMGYRVINIKQNIEGADLLDKTGDITKKRY